MMDFINEHTSFGEKSRFTMASKFEPTGNIWTVEKPNSPDVTSSYSANAEFSGSLTGRISHPTLSGQIPPKWLSGDPYALWELYAEASLKLSGAVSLKYLNEYSPSQMEFQGDGSLGGTLKSGAYAVAKVLGYFTEGDVNLNVGVGYSIETSGTNPHKKVEGALKVDPLKFNTTFKLERKRDNHVIAEVNFSHVIWNGYTQDPKTAIYEQPENPK